MTNPATPLQASASWLWGPYSRLGLAVLLVTLLVDQAHKWWMILVYRIEEKGQAADDALPLAFPCPLSGRCSRSLDGE